MWRPIPLLTVACVAALLCLGVAAAPAEEPSGQTRFASADAAMKALVAAVRAGDRTKLLAILGPEGKAVLSSGDEVEDANDGRRFVARASERTRFETIGEGEVIAHIGRQGTPFAIPIVKDGDQWRFDTAGGKEELLNRRIGRNELQAIAAARAYVDAQEEYARADPTKSGTRVYAQKFVSTPGQRDGLYWDAAGGAEESPLGPLFASASGEGYQLAEQPAAPQPFHGYLFHILTAQGPKAPGGAKSYVADGKMTGGHALVAWPAEYGKSGIMTFVVDRKGIVFQKDLGPQTVEAVKAITAYEPDDSWMPTR